MSTAEALNGYPEDKNEGAASAVTLVQLPTGEMMDTGIIVSEEERIRHLQFLAISGLRRAATYKPEINVRENYRMVKDHHKSRRDRQ